MLYMFTVQFLWVTTSLDTIWMLNIGLVVYRYFIILFNRYRTGIAYYVFKAKYKYKYFKYFWTTVKDFFLEETVAQKFHYWAKACWAEAHPPVGTRRKCVVELWDSL